MQQGGNQMCKYGFTVDQQCVFCKDKKGDVEGLRDFDVAFSAFFTFDMRNETISEELEDEPLIGLSIKENIGV